MITELERVLSKEKVSQQAKNNLDVAIRALLNLNGPTEVITNKMVHEAVGIIERRTKRKGAGKLISFHDVSVLF